MPSLSIVYPYAIRKVIAPASLTIGLTEFYFHIDYMDAYARSRVLNKCSRLFQYVE